METLIAKAALGEIQEYLKLNDYGFIFEFKYDDALGGLKITKRGSSVVICFSEKAYLFRALGLLKERAEEESFTLIQKSNFTMNGIMLDCSRNAVANCETVKKIIRQLALMGLNTLMLYTEDTYEVSENPYFGYFRGRYTEAELKELDDYAFAFGVELVPCIQTLGHLGNVTKYSNTYGTITDLPGILLIDEENTYIFIENMVKACRRAFRSKRIHIGMDEAHFMGRGKYFDKHGAAEQQTLFSRHLNMVSNICDKYGFRPMIWGDMPLRNAGCSGYTDSDLSLRDIFPINIPDCVDSIYWDYYSKTPERYDEFIKKHKEIFNNVIFAGGARRWHNFAPNLRYSLKISQMALSKCIENGIKEVFVTLWGDNGNEQSYFSCWPTVQLYAEYGFNDSVNDDELANRFKTCTGGIFEDFFCLDDLNRPDGLQEEIMAENPPKYLFYQDILMGLYDYYVKDGYNTYYLKCAEKLKECARLSEEYAYIFETTAALCDILADKAELGVKIKNAYDLKDDIQLKKIAETIIPKVILNVGKFRDLFEKQWNKENKIFGFEVMDIRFGGLIRRLMTAKERIEAYLNGEAFSLPELEQERLPFDSHTEKAVLSANWSGIVSASNL